MNIVVDIDGVLSDDRWRHDLRGDWDAYQAEAHKDQAVQPLVCLINCLVLACNAVVLITGRNERWRQPTMKWLLDNQVWVQDLLMRPDGDYRKSPELKLALAQDRFKGEPIHLVIDDREDILAAFRSTGAATMMVSY